MTCETPDTPHHSNQHPQRELGECPICGGTVEQKNTPETGRCELCGKPYETYYHCENGCQFCDSCYGTYAFMKLSGIISTTSKNPIDILNTMMRNETFGLRGCIHCAAAPLAFILAFRNTANLSRISFAMLIDCFKIELDHTPISLCKKNGTCGIAITCGNAIANIPLVVDERYRDDKSVGNELKNECKSVISGICGENACCKQIAYLEIIKMAHFINRYLWIQLQMPRIVTCEFAEGNPCCEKEKCRFYNGYRTKQCGDRIL